MEGGANTDIITAAVIAACVIAATILAFYAIRRARKSRQQQIEQVGDGSSAFPAKPTKAALRPEDIAPGEAKSPPPVLEVPQKAEAAVPTPAAAPRPEGRPDEQPPIAAVPSAPARATAAAVPRPVASAARAVAVPVDKPRTAEVQTRPKARDSAALAPGLARTRAGWISRLGQVFAGKREIDPALVEEIEKVLLTADIGVRTSQKLLEEIRSSLGRRELAEPSAVWRYLRKRSVDFLRVDAPPVDFSRSKPFVLLTIGVNGSGKTTTIGKLASKLRAEGKSVLLAAGDTFRAAATEQLEIWGGRVGAPVVRGKEGSDPSSVVFEGIKRAGSEHIDVVIADTAGRLHTKSDLMEELQKVRRVAGKALDGAPHETWLVIDATSGQNAIAQAQIFAQAMSVTGIVLTKLDGTAKGGVILGITDQLGIPVRYIGVGERVEDLREFDAEEFVEALFGNAETASEVAC
jgi:fused signal recognition particle receptor